MNAPTNVNTPMPSPRRLAGWVRTLGWWTNTVPNKAGSMTESPSRVGISGSPATAESRPGTIGRISLGSRSKQESAVREIRMLRSTRRGLETWHGRDAVTLATERARQQGTQTSTYTGAPVPDPTDEREWETERCRMAQATAPILDSTKADVDTRSYDVARVPKGDSCAAPKST